MAYSSAVALTVTAITRDGIDVTTLPTTPTATHGNKAAYHDNMWFEVENGSGSDITVTIDSPFTVDGQAVYDKEVTVGNGERIAIGQIGGIFKQSDGYVWIICSDVTSVTIGAYRPG